MFSLFFIFYLSYRDMAILYKDVFLERGFFLNARLSDKNERIHGFITLMINSDIFIYIFIQLSPCPSLEPRLNPAKAGLRDVTFQNLD